MSIKGHQWCILALCFTTLMYWLLYTAGIQGNILQHKTEENLRKRSSHRHVDWLVSLKHVFNPEFIINNSRLCELQPRELLMIVVSSPQNEKQRNAIRMAYQNHTQRQQFTLGFFIGKTKDDFLQSKVENESKQHGDMIQSSNIDSLGNLPIKFMAILKWSTVFCPTAKFMFKVDDDVFVNLNMLMSFISTINPSVRTMYGYVFRNAPVDRNMKSKYWLSYEEFGGRNFPDYISGTATVLPAALVSPLLEASLHHMFTAMVEDVLFTGIIPEQLGITRQHNAGFNSDRKAGLPSCALFKLITSHGVSANEHIRFHKYLIENERNCKKERN